MPGKPKESEKTLQLDLSNYVPAQVTFLSNKLSSGASACYRRHFGIGIVEWRIFALLKIEPNISANRICQVIGLDKAAVSRALKTLNAQGYVSFEKDEKDARSSLVNLTKSGVALHDKILKVALKREKILLQELTKEEISTLLVLLEKLNSRVAEVNEYDPKL
jgi:DNA-binding MarR family transcriptional regulator